MLEDIAMDRNVLVREGSLKKSEAYLVRLKNKGVIKVRESIPERGRKRFAIAHELGHWELHYDSSQFNYCSEDDINGYQGSTHEIEANVFASELLMPTRIISPKYRTATPSIETIKQISSEFDVTLTAAAVKFVQISKEDCLVAFSKDGMVQWWRKGKEFSSIPGIERHHPLHPESEASEIYLGRPPSSKMVKVPTEAWFPYIRNRFGLEVHEQSFKLGRYSTILSILWVIFD